MRERKPTDWEAIEREYRAGQLSVREIARQHGVTDTAIRKKAKEYGWSRDLTAAVRDGIRSNLVRNEVRTDSAREPSDREAVQAAVSRGVEVVRQHRAALGRLQRIAAILAERLEAHLSGEAASGPLLGERESPADLMEKLSRTMSKAIALERQAFSLDDPERDKDGGPYDLSDTERGARIAALLERARARGTGSASD